MLSHVTRLLIILGAVSIAAASCDDGDKGMDARPTATEAPQSLRTLTSLTNLPSDRTESARLPLPTLTGIDPLDATLRAISRNEGVVDEVELVDYACVSEAASTEGPHCVNAEQGTRIPSFLFIGPAGTEYITDQATIEDALAKALGSRGNALYSVALATDADPRGSAYVVGFRVPTGNLGKLWYVSETGGIIGVRANGADFFGATPIPNVTYICGPTHEPGSPC
jgi:hypothetical protein